MFTISSTSRLLAIRWAQRAEGIKVKVMLAEAEALKIAKAKAIEASSQTFYGGKGIGSGKNRIYPYSVKTPVYAGVAHLANIQRSTGTRGLPMVFSWHTQLESIGGEVISSLYNTAPHSRFFDGNPTRKMIARLLLQRVMEEVAPIRAALLDAAIVEALGEEFALEVF